MALSTKPFSQIVSDQAVTAQASAPGRDLDFSVGSTLRALAEGFGSIGLWLQGLVLRLLATTRASTSSGDDLGTWMADYGLTRSAANPARGSVTLARFTPGLPAMVPVGATVKTVDGAWTYAITDDGASLDEVLGGYQVVAGQTSITLPVVATVAGAGGNAAAGTVTLLSSSIPGIDTVTNAAPLVGGTEAETDAALRTRFAAYIASLPRAVRIAIDYAVSQVQAGLSWTVLEQQLPDGTSAPATFTVVVDDGTGAPPSDLLTRVAAAVEEFRPLGVSFAVVAPVLLPANIDMKISTVSETDHAVAVAAVAKALTDYINALPLGSGLSYNRLSQVALSASPLVDDVTSFTINGGFASLPAAPRQAIRAAIVGVS